MHPVWDIPTRLFHWTLPVLVGENGLPVGVQLIGAGEEDDRLMRTAAWVQKALADAGENGE